MSKKYSEEVKSLNLVKTEDIDLLDISQIRKIFKPLFIPFLTKHITDKPYNMKSDLEIKIVFEFVEDFYDKIFDNFSFIPTVKKMGQKKFKPDIGMDKGYINEFLKSCSSDLLVSLFNKFKLLDFKTNQDLLEIRVDIINANIYLNGNYLKFSREIGQSPWTVNGVKICQSSVEEEMKQPLINFFKSDGCVMSAGGREDRDVRMLGSGRPFIMEIVNPKHKNIVNIKDIEKTINNSTHLIQIKDLTVCDKNYYAVLKKYEDSKTKFYTCLVWVSKTITTEDIEKINTVVDLVIIQKTPIRVMHRRTLMDRKKTIFKLEASQINDNFMVK